VTTVDVMGEQYKWHFRYPDTKAKYKGEDDVKSTGVMRVPIGDKILCNLRSKDVIHSFFVPHMRVKQDAVPGLRQRAWFKPNRIKLVDLKKPTKADPDGYKKPDGTVRQLQEIEWVAIEGEAGSPGYDPDKPFKKGGAYFGKRIALSDYAEVDGFYAPIYVQAVGQAKKVRVLFEGNVLESQDWKSCDYALGIFEIACAELCGMAHYTMRSSLIVEPRVSYDWWMTEEAANPSDVPAFKFWKD
jgi:hypothetical protein